MKQIAFTAILIVIASSNAIAKPKEEPFNRSVGNPVPTVNYITGLHNTIGAGLVLNIHRDKRGKEWFSLHPVDSGQHTTYFSKSTKHQRQLLQSILSKTLDWSSIAMDSGVETSKQVGCMSVKKAWRFGLTDDCSMGGSIWHPYERGQVQFTFIATDRGQTSVLEIAMYSSQPGYHLYSKIQVSRLFVPMESVTQLLDNVSNINTSFALGKSDANNSPGLFK